MTYFDLLSILLNWQKLGHISFNDPIEVNINGDIFPVDIIESLSTGKAMLIATGGDDDAS